MKTKTTLIVSAAFLLLGVFGLAQTSGYITTTANMNFYPSTSVELVELTATGELHVFFSEPSNVILTSNPPIVPPPHRYKKIFVAKDGKIVLDRTVDAKVTPSVPERVEWPK